MQVCDCDQFEPAEAQSGKERLSLGALAAIEEHVSPPISIAVAETLRLSVGARTGSKDCDSHGGVVRRLALRAPGERNPYADGRRDQQHGESPSQRHEQNRGAVIACRVWAVATAWA